MQVGVGSDREMLMVLEHVGGLSVSVGGVTDSVNPTVTGRVGVGRVQLADMVAEDRDHVAGRWNG